MFVPCTHKGFRRSLPELLGTVAQAATGVGGFGEGYSNFGPTASHQDAANGALWGSSGGWTGGLGSGGGAPPSASAASAFDPFGDNPLLRAFAADRCGLCCDKHHVYHPQHLIRSETIPCCVPSPQTGAEFAVTSTTSITCIICTMQGSPMLM